MSTRTGLLHQCRQPHGWLGRWFLGNMNKRHSPLTDWGLSHIAVAAGATVLDIGCGGGRTIAKLAAAAPDGKVYGLDHSAASVAASQRTNGQAIRRGQVEIRQGSVSQLPWPPNTFNLVTAVETHFFWPNLPSDVHEVFRVVASAGSFILIAEVYKGAGTQVSKMAEKYSHISGMTLLSADEHRALLADAGFSDVQIFEEHTKGWICALGVKPS